MQAVFAQGLPIDRIYFPTKSSQIPNRAALTIVVLPPENGDIEETKTLQLVDSMTKQSGTSDRTFKSALIWCVPDSGRQLCDEARKLLAWEDIQERRRLSLSWKTCNENSLLRIKASRSGI